MAKDFADISRLELAQDRNEAKRDAVSKMVKAWEGKNAKRALQGAGLSTMAVTLAACGGSSTAVVPTTPVEPTTPTTPTTPVVPTTPAAQALTITAGIVGETITGGDGADTITGVTTSTASTNGLGATDVISGGNGADTLVLTLGANFGGFTTGSMSGVETVSLASDSPVARTFDASGVVGVTTYTVNGTNAAVSITDAQTVSTLNLSNQSSGSMTLTLDAAAATAATAIAGSADALAFNVSAVGTANTAAATLPSNAAHVSLVTSGYETVNVTSSGAAQNLISMASAAGARTINLSGTDLSVDNVSAATTTIDASGMTGALDIGTSNAGTSALASIILGAGNDTVRIMATDLSATASINGKAGSDTISLVGAGLTMAPTIVEVERLDVTEVTGTSIISLLNSAAAANGLTIVLDNPRNATESFTGTLTLANDTGATSFDINGAHGAGTITTTTTGALTIDADPAGGATSAQVIAANITANSASSLTIDSARFADLNGTISANAAESLTFTTTRQTTDVTIEADAAKTLTLTANGAHLDLTGDDFAAATTIVANGAAAAGTGGQITLGVIGSAAGTDSATSITVSNLAGNFTTGAVDSGAGTLAVNTAASLGTTTLASTTSGGAITITNTGSLGVLATGVISASDGGITLNSTNAIGAVTLGAVGVEGAAVFNLDGMLGTFATGDVTATSFTLNANTYAGTAITGDTYTVDSAATLNTGAAGTHIVAHAADKTHLTVTVGGSSGIDDYTVNHGVLTTNLTVTGNSGAGADLVTVGTNTVFSTVNTSGLTGVTGAGGVDFAIAAVGASYTGGAMVDTITTGGIITVASSINTGAGADSITLGHANTAVVTIDAGAGADTVTVTLSVGAGGEDRIVVENGDSGLTDATADNIIGFATADSFKIGFAGVAANFAVVDQDAGADLATDVTAVNALMNGTVRIVVVQDQTNSDDGLANVFIDFDGDGSADVGLDLSVITAGYDLVAADFIA